MTDFLRNMYVNVVEQHMKNVERTELDLSRLIVLLSVRVL
jgi:hypothetical protein